MNTQNTAGTDIKYLHGGSTKRSIHFKLYRKLLTVMMNKQNTAGTDIKYLHDGSTKRSLHFKL